MLTNKQKTRRDSTLISKLGGKEKLTLKKFIKTFDFLSRDILPRNIREALINL